MGFNSGFKGLTVEPQYTAGRLPFGRPCSKDELFRQIIKTWHRLYSDCVRKQWVTA